MNDSNKTAEHSQLPVCVVTGFLGAGKTSLVNHFMSSGHGLRVGVLVNDFGAIDIDSQLVESVTEDSLSLRNGCICCTMRDDFFDAILKLVRRETPPEVIVIETSGVSDPRSVVLTLTEPDLTDVLRVDSVVSVVDSDTFDSLSEEESRLAVAQVGEADLVVFNKTDLVDEEKLNRLEADVRKMAPMARFFHTVHGKVPIAALLSWDSLDHESSSRRQSVQSSFLGAPVPKVENLKIDGLAPNVQAPNGLVPVEPLKPFNPHQERIHPHHHGSHKGCCGEHEHGTHEGCCGEHHHHENEQTSLSDAFESFSLVIDPPLSMDKVRDVLMNLPLPIYRLKGLFHVDANPKKQLLIQVVGPRISAAAVKPWGEKPRCSEIVAIGLKGSVDKVKMKSLFESCIAKQEGGFLKGLKERTLFWRRGDHPSVDQRD